MSSSETKMDEMIAVQVSEQDYAGMLVPKKCDEQEKTDEKQREAGNGIGQQAEADDGTGQAAEADNETGQPAEVDDGTGQPAEADDGTGQPAEADDGTGQPAEADDGTGQPAEKKKPRTPLSMLVEGPMIYTAVEGPMNYTTEFNWPEEDEEFDGRNVVVIGINNDIGEAEEVFNCKSSALL